VQHNDTTDPAAAAEHSATAVDGSCAFAGGLQAGAMYAMGVETAAARGGLIVVPLLSALSEGRPCVLITPLEPDEDAFKDMLLAVPGAAALPAALHDGRLKLFCAIGDYGVNLFIHGAVGFVRELEQFGVEPGSLVVIDQADDLFTAHDHLAAAHQAQVYQQWCRSQGHTLLMLHLRSSPARPLLDGNQAALQPFSGVARITSERGGLCMSVDFWRTATGCRVGEAMSLDTFWGAATAAARTAVETAGSLREEFWYAGPHDADFAVSTHDVRWRRVDSVDDILRAGGAGQGALLVFDAADDFSTFLERVVALRRLMGEQARIVVRESHYRLREHLQRRMLLWAGADAVLARNDPATMAAELLRAPRNGTALDAAVPSEATMDRWTDLAANSRRIGLLPTAHFTVEAEELLRRSGFLDIPCTLAEVHVEGEREPGWPPIEHLVTRTGDLATSAHGAQIFLLHGCRDRQALEVVTRWIEHAGGCAVDRITLFTGHASIAKRLGALRVEATNDREISPQPSVAIMATVALLFSVALGSDARAQPAASNTAPAVTAATAAPDSATRAYQEERYTDAARLGLVEVSKRPDDHDLRLKVANSLAWTGQYALAAQQYRALATSPLATEATLGLANVYLWSGQPHLAQPLFQAVLASNPAQADALDGIARLRRELQPRTTLRLSTAGDSGKAERSGLAVSHRWRDAGLNQIFELAADRNKEQRSPDTGDLKPREVSFAYQHLGLPLAPRLELSAQSSPTSKLFGDLSARLPSADVTVSAGRVNWGQLVFDARALRDGLTANRVGIAAATDTPAGQLAGSFNQFAVSDGNRVREFNLRYTPQWQPAPARTGVKLFAGLYGRGASRQVDRYWSPTVYNTADVGLALGRWEAEWQLEGELKRSFGIGGEGANGWTLGTGALRWLNRDWAIQGNLAYQETSRSGSRYRYDALSAALIRVW
jgi:hypothetical protein